MMTEKKSSNPFINMANEAKARATKITPEKAHQIQKAKEQTDRSKRIEELKKLKKNSIVIDKKSVMKL